MVPFTAIMIPLFYILRDIGVLRTYWAMILPQTAISLPFGIFFMRAFFSGLPYDLTDAAKIDGCNDFGVFRRVMLPLAGPAVAALVVFNFMGSWNAFLLPLIYLQSDKLRPVMTGMMFFTTRWGVDYSMSMAGTLIVMAADYGWCIWSSSASSSRVLRPARCGDKVYPSPGPSPKHQGGECKSDINEACRGHRYLKFATFLGDQRIMRLSAHQSLLPGADLTERFQRAAECGLDGIELAFRAAGARI